MRRRALQIALIIPILAWPMVGRAGPVHLDGKLIQGGIVFGTTDPGAHVTLDGRTVRVAPDGRFVFGFGRDAADHAVLEVVSPDGTQEERRLKIKKRVYKVQRIDGLPQKMVTPPPEVLARIHADAQRVWAARSVDRPKAFFESGFIWPATGPISGVFGSQRILNGKPRRPHFGVDVAAPEGSPVVAPADGVVTMADSDLYYTGGTVVLDHGHGLTTTYSHLKKVLVKEGQVLHQGDVLGRVGATGRATGPHLDWRVNWFEVRMDPQYLVPPMPKQSAKSQ
jgi:murein DD-endopeptidase MepM/ murein hydrolase activator NlpD